MPGGRPCKLTPEVQRAIIDALKIGATRRIAAEFAGTSVGSLHAWLVSDTPEHVAFRAAVVGAEAKASVAALAKIQKAATDGNWQAAAWLLERRHPDEYGRRLPTSRSHPSLVDAGTPDIAALESAYSAGKLDGAALLRALGVLTATAGQLAGPRKSAAGGKTIDV